MSDGWSAMSEDDLVRRAQRGSQDAMVELYRRHRGLVIGYILRMTGDRDLADEVFAASFASFFASLNRYKSRGHLAAFLLRIARNRLVDELKARSRLGSGGNSRKSADFAPSEPVDARPGPLDSVETAELAGRAEQALLELPELLREVVVLRLYEGLDYAAIGAIVDAKEATVRSRMRYALQALRKTLDTSREP